MSGEGKGNYGFRRYFDKSESNEDFANDTSAGSSSSFSNQTQDVENSNQSRKREWSEQGSETGRKMTWGDKKNTRGQGSRLGSQRPPGLKGKQIGLWYAQRNRERKEKEMGNSEEDRLEIEMRKQAKRDDLNKKPLATVFLSQATQNKIQKFLNNTSGEYTTMRRQNSYEHLQDTDFKHDFLTHINGNIDDKLDRVHNQMMPPRNATLDNALYNDLLEKRAKNKQYQTMQKIREKLPSMQMREEILELIENNQVVVISGETGCGKTTQVSQFILDHYIENKKGSLCRVICTQPRRISAISVSERVAQERAEKLGQSVGFQIRLEKTPSRDQGSILFCTTGVLVKFMEGNFALEGVSHIILDEIHERDVISDFLITLLKDVITVRKDLKVILMSATLNSDAFSRYYNNAPHLTIPGFTYPVQEYFLEDVLAKTEFSFEYTRKRSYDWQEKRVKEKERQDYIEPWIRQLEGEKKYKREVIRELYKPESEEMNLDLIYELLEYICHKSREDDGGAILVFVTGFVEIQALIKKLNFSKRFNRDKYVIVPLHSQLDTVNQKQIFNPAPPGKRKIIVSTNIAETSITIEDVTTVINCGYIKMTNLHQEFGYETLNPEFVSKANLGQRRGRAGRVKEGVCYHLLSRGRYNILEQFQKPEILRRRLEDVVLSVKLLQLGKAEPFLAKLMDPPNPEAVRTSVALLERLGALDEDEKLTPLGYHMSHLPVGAQPAKMLIMACIFSCLDPILSIAATIGFKEPFQISSDDPKAADRAREELAQGCKSDHILMHYAIKGFEEAQQYNQTWSYCRRYFLSHHTLVLLKDMRRQFTEQLYNMKFLVSKNPNEPCHNMNSNNISLIKAVICAGLYPNVFICNPKRRQVLRSVNHERMGFHVKCLLSKVRNEAFDSILGVYHQRLKTKTLSLHDATLVQAYPLVFFGDNYKIRGKTNIHEAETITINEGKMTFKCKVEAAQVIKKMRIRLNQILEHMIGHPASVDWSKNTTHVQFLSRSKPALSSAGDNENQPKRASSGKIGPQFEDFLMKRDYTGAITLLEFHKYADKDDNANTWMAYCYFHRGDYKNALQIYQKLNEKNSEIKNMTVNIGCCYFYLGMYNEAQEILQNAPSSELKTRLNFHTAHKLKDETSLMEYHQQLQDILEDQLSLAAIHYLRAHYQEAIDIYKRLLLQNREFIALNVYVALCYYKLDYYDVSQEVLGLYLSRFPNSVIATNLKACNTFRLYNGTAAENELRGILDQAANVGFGYDLIRHNLVVFRDGEDAMQVFPSLVDVVPEARLNLVIHHLRNDDIKEAFKLLKDVQPSVPQEYILKGVVHAALGQEINSQEHIKTAEECFHLVGSSTSECDTIHGRQCMAAAFFLAQQYEEVLVYLTSIKSYLHSDDTFNFNFAQAKTACGQYKEAEESFLLIQDPKIKNDYVYICNLARCHIMNKKPQDSWELYLKMETSSESFNLLLQIANDCYKMGEFWYAAKAFDMLDRLDPNPEFWEGKRGAIVGVFQGVVAKRLPVDTLSDILQLLRSSTSSQAEQIAKVIRKWAKEQKVAIN